MIFNMVFVILTFFQTQIFYNKVFYKTSILKMYSTHFIAISRRPSHIKKTVLHNQRHIQLDIVWHSYKTDHIAFENYA